jgi:hypothetical protein
MCKEGRSDGETNGTQCQSELIVIILLLYIKLKFNKKQYRQTRRLRYVRKDVQTERQVAHTNTEGAQQAGGLSS